MAQSEAVAVAFLVTDSDRTPVKFKVCVEQKYVLAIIVLVAVVFPFKFIPDGFLICRFVLLNINN